ncbi:MAG: transposase [Acidimicrobiales bacterium]
MNRFPNPKRLCSWAGMTPRHRESDEKVRRGKIECRVRGPVAGRHRVRGRSAESDCPSSGPIAVCP